MAALAVGGLLAATLAVPAAAQDGLDWMPQLSTDDEDPDNDFVPLQDGDGMDISVAMEMVVDPGDPGGADDHVVKMEYPADWDAEGFAGPVVLVLYAHGFVSPVDPVQAAQGNIVPTPLVAQDIPGRDLVVGNGLAWAASSYTANGYTIDQPVETTLDLVEMFETETGFMVDQVHMVGVSMGGHVAGVAIERSHTDGRDFAIAGAMPICGVMGDQALFDYYGNVNLVGQALTGLMPESAVVPLNYLDPGDPTADPPRAPGPGVLMSGALGLFPDQQFNRGGHLLGRFVEHESGGERPFFEHAWSFWNSDLTAIGPFPFLPGVIGGAITGAPDNAPVGKYDNTNTLYTIDGNEDTNAVEALVNSLVTRDGEDDGASFAHPVITGQIETTKVVTYHTIGDLFVPFGMQQDYRRDVEAAGFGDHLVQRAIRGLGHCDFTEEELAQGVADLLAWVLLGFKPEGDDVLAVEEVSHRLFGCDHTIDGANPPPDRMLIPSCEDAARPPATRIAGDDRFGTAVEAALAGWADPSTVLVTTGRNFPDALSAASLAGVEGAPIVLTEADELPLATSTYLRDTTPDDDEMTMPSAVYVIGGENAINASVIDEIEDIVGEGTTMRIDGDDRYATAANLAAQARTKAPAPPTTVIVARGDSFADANAVSAAAYFTQFPLVLVRPDELPEVTAAELRAGGYDAVLVIGGEAAISEDVVEAILDELPMAAVARRLAGPDRYATSAEVIGLSMEVGLNASQPTVATGLDFPDAVTAGPAAAARGQLFGLVNGQVPEGGDAVIGALVASSQVEGFDVAGGPAAVADAVVDRIRDRLERTEG